MRTLIALVDGLRYDLCVLTGDYRGKTYRTVRSSAEGVACSASPTERTGYGVLGNHDTIRMVPGLEAMGIRMLLNECATIARRRSATSSGRYR